MVTEITEKWIKTIENLMLITARKYGTSIIQKVDPNLDLGQDPGLDLHWDVTVIVPGHLLTPLTVLVDPAPHGLDCMMKKCTKNRILNMMQEIIKDLLMLMKIIQTAPGPNLLQHTTVSRGHSADIQILLDPARQCRETETETCQSHSLAHLIGKASVQHLLCKILIIGNGVDPLGLQKPDMPWIVGGLDIVQDQIHLLSHTAIVPDLHTGHCNCDCSTSFWDSQETSQNSI